MNRQLNIFLLFLLLLGFMISSVPDVEDAFTPPAGKVPAKNKEAAVIVALQPLPVSKSSDLDVFVIPDISEEGAGTAVHAPESFKPPVRIAIILDDWGYSRKNLELLDALTFPLTLSILPGLPYSNTVSDWAAANGHEVILHLPMEAIGQDPSREEKDTIKVGMADAKIDEILDRHLRGLHNVSGISNHTGSLATQNREVMDAVFGYMKDKGYFFVDSLVTNKSVCEDEAAKFGLLFLKRDVFIDNVKDPEYISGQLDKLISMALSRGYAVGIGHDNAVTLKTLAENADDMRGKGIDLVTVKELLNHLGDYTK